MATTTDKENRIRELLIKRIPSKKISEIIRNEFNEGTDSQLLKRLRRELSEERKVIQVSQKVYLEFDGKHCVYCGRELKDSISISRGIGPECFNRSQKTMKRESFGIFKDEYSVFRRMKSKSTIRKEGNDLFITYKDSNIKLVVTKIRETKMLDENYQSIWNIIGDDKTIRLTIYGKQALLFSLITKTEEIANSGKNEIGNEFDVLIEKYNLKLPSKFEFR